MLLCPPPHTPPAPQPLAERQSDSSRLLPAPACMRVSRQREGSGTQLGTATGGAGGGWDFLLVGLIGFSTKINEICELEGKTYGCRPRTWLRPLFHHVCRFGGFRLFFVPQCVCFWGYFCCLIFFFFFLESQIYIY